MMPLDPSLQEQARDAIRSGRLPSRAADRVVGGPGSEAACAVCGDYGLRSMTELEIQFNHDGARPQRPDSYRLHHRCFAAWEFERTKPTESEERRPSI